MQAYDVIVWEDGLSDGSTCYAAWCTSVLGVSGQGDTEDAALADILSAMAANVFDPWPEDWPAFQDDAIAEAELRQLVAELTASATWYRRHQITQDMLRAAYRPVQETTEVRG